MLISTRTSWCHQRPPLLAFRLVCGAAFVLILSVASGAGPAWAAGAPNGPPVQCQPQDPFCTVQAQSPGQPGSGSNTAPAQPVSAPACTVPADLPGGGSPVACHDAQFGWWNNSDGCYYQLAQPQPPPSDVAWAGHYPSGAVYDQVCFWIRGTGGGLIWLAAPPPGFGGGITPAQLAQRAVRLLRLDGPAIGMAPPPGSTGLVGVPVWLWTTVAPTTWGPTSATATVPGLSVTATGTADHIVWQMGDGHSVTCPNPGTPYQQSLGAGPSPTCGYQYSKSSAGQPQAKYAVTATTTWNVTWSGGGQTGQLTVTRSSTVHVGIGELQVLVS